MQTGERQVAPTRDGIRRDHVARYEWAAKHIGDGKKVADVACGVGYGTQLLAEAGHLAAGYDRDREAIDYARQHYAHARADFIRADVVEVEEFAACDVVVCFETIEHIADPLPLLKALHASGAPMLLASVPNEDVLPWAGTPFHFRHYTQSEFDGLLAAAGWRVVRWFGQEGAESDVVEDLNGRTLIAEAVRIVPPQPVQIVPAPRPDKIPGHVAIAALGPSVVRYLDVAMRRGSRARLCDELWGINALGDVLACDRIFHMDDVRIQEIRAAANPEGNIAAMLPWLKKHPGPVYTSRPHPDYPGLVAFPLEAVLNDVPKGYMNSTAAHAVAFAVWLGVKKITLFGMDFTYANSHHAEKGRACVEFWLGVAAARGIEIAMPKESSLMDARESQAERFYGYDTLDLAIERKDGLIRIGFTEKEALPSAEEVEHRYDHTRHPNAIVERKLKET